MILQSSVDISKNNIYIVLFLMNLKSDYPKINVYNLQNEFCGTQSFGFTIEVSIHIVIVFETV